MKITIDTKEDSPEELKKLIRLLSSLVEREEVVANKDIFEQEETPRENVFSSIFESKSDGIEKDDKEKAEKKVVEQIGDDMPDVEIY